MENFKYQGESYFDHLVKQFEDEYTHFWNYSSEELQRYSGLIRKRLEEGKIDSLPTYSDFLESDGHDVEKCEDEDFDGPSYISYVEYFCGL
jgi:hypothetical protein